jgi:hypothetical protein
MSMTRCLRFAARAALLLAVAGGAMADARTDFGDARAVALDGAVARVFPGARLAWAETITITMPDGARSEVTVPGLAEMARAQGPFYVMEVEFPDFARERALALRTFPDRLPESSHPADLFVAMQTNAGGEILSFKSGRLDPAAALVDTRDFELAEDAAETPWPAVKVTYWAHYGSPDWYGSVRWIAGFDSETMTNLSRAPLGLTKTRKTGEALQDQILASRASSEVVHFQGGMTGKTVDLPCAYPCLLEGRTLLASW